MYIHITACEVRASATKFRPAMCASVCAYERVIPA